MQWFSTKRESPEEFWRSTEEALGESVRLYTIGRCFGGCTSDDREVWGLFFVTERALYFRHFPSSNWFSAILQTATSPASHTEEIYFSIPLADITEVHTERETSLLKRIFTYSPPRLVVAHQGRAAALRFVVESKLEELRALITPE